jgi:VanZ family protein
MSLPVILLTAAISLASSQSQITPPDEIHFLDKILHFFAFFIYGIFARFYFEVFKFEDKSKIIAAISISILFGIFDELHQSFVPGRDASIYDLIADIAGVLVSYIFWNKLIQLFRTKFKNKCLS